MGKSFCNRVISLTFTELHICWTLETILTCLYPYTVQTRPLAGTASGMASDSVRGRGNICGADLEIKSKRGDGTLLIF